MNKITRRTFLATGAAASTIALSQLGKIQPISAQSKEINLYSARHYNTDQELYKTFTRQTGIKVNLVEGKANELIERIKSEGRNSKADILLTVDAGNLWLAQQQGLFSPISSKILNSKIPANLRDAGGHWFGFSKRVRVIMYDKTKINPSQLSTYEDLANPKWKGKIVVRSSSNVYNQSMVAWLIAINGEAATEKWCRGLVANFARSPQGGDRDQIEAVASGQAQLAIANTYYLASYGESKEAAKQEIFKKIGVFFPNQKKNGAHINISGGGVLKNSRNKENAKKFLEYLVTPAAQDFFARGNNEYPVVKGIKLDPILASFGNFKSDTTAVSKYGQNLAKAVKLMDRALWK